MIAEALLYAATWPLTGKTHRKFIRYSVNLWSRAGRCAAEWADHEEKSRNAIRAATADLRRKRTAVVLGSGLLRDVPIEELARAFDTVVLVDLVHLASVRLSTKTHRNIRLIERDLSDYDELAAGREPEPLGFLRTVPYLDFVVSANLLSQIGRGVKRRCEAGDAGMPDDTVERLIAAHIAGLSGLACRHCLVTDIAYAVIDRNGRTHEEADLLFGVSPPPSKTTWKWPVAPLGEESQDYRIEHKVIATW
ncbi:hypothetical protein ABID08_003639 [Rhizobium binae]|uniref:Uncharacterized protein n=1 Tax=Rhizobium binae TaxID=1138190 RepID=A0ABV2MIQ2_9HYPH|nr:hypothetical protein [Rhizobium binae]MBX4994082.1 hypothetical protein [Rhizobium binae]NKL50142.1 hypothetical protein [Rhizobium leguminosarum bv. viciae]QSY83054.1 hypothetical protein J2J99_04325 [Rhizobium binae]